MPPPDREGRNKSAPHFPTAQRLTLPPPSALCTFLASFGGRRLTAAYTGGGWRLPDHKARSPAVRTDVQQGLLRFYCARRGPCLLSTQRAPSRIRQVPTPRPASRRWPSGPYAA